MRMDACDLQAQRRGSWASRQWWHCRRLGFLMWPWLLPAAAQHHRRGCWNSRHSRMRAWNAGSLPKPLCRFTPTSPLPPPSATHRVPLHTCACARVSPPMEGCG